MPRCCWVPVVEFLGRVVEEILDEREGLLRFARFPLSNGVPRVQCPRVTAVRRSWVIWPAIAWWLHMSARQSIVIGEDPGTVAASAIGGGFAFLRAQPFLGLRCGVGGVTVWRTIF